MSPEENEQTTDKQFLWENVKLANLNKYGMAATMV